MGESWTALSLLTTQSFVRQKRAHTHRLSPPFLPLLSSCSSLRTQTDSGDPLKNYVKRCWDGGRQECISEDEQVISSLFVEWQPTSNVYAWNSDGMNFYLSSVHRHWLLCQWMDGSAIPIVLSCRVLMYTCKPSYSLREFLFFSLFYRLINSHNLLVSHDFRCYAIPFRRGSCRFESNAFVSLTLKWR